MPIDPSITESTKKNLSLYFNGDSEGSVYNYRTFTQLADLYHSRFGATDFPPGASRWILCSNTMEDMARSGRIHEFFTVMLSVRNISKELEEPDLAISAEKRQSAIKDINRILLADDLELLEVSGSLILHGMDDDSNLIGSGGFAKVYKVPGKNLVVKKLKDEFKANAGIISRFKNEFRLITENLKGIPGIIRAYSYNSDEISYTMEYCASDLKAYLRHTGLSEEARILLILEILEIMQCVHERNVLHRDLSPKNIFIKSGHAVIADFGLGKAIDEHGRTYCTLDTSCNGTLEYCDPRQFQGLTFADRQADIYSLGRIINFIMTADPDNFDHALSTISTIATQTSLSARYHQVSEMIHAINRKKIHRDREEYALRCKQKILARQYSEDMADYLLSFDEDELLKQLNNSDFRAVYLHILSNPSYEAVVLEKFSALLEIFENPIGHTFSLFDAASNFCVHVLDKGKRISPGLKIILGKCIYAITVEVSRFGARRYFRSNYPLLEAEYVQDTIDEMKNWN